MKNILIIVPTFNSYKLLPMLIDSLEKQSYLKWRLIFVDGKSSQEHRNWIINKCSENNRYNWIPQSENSNGIYGAMNDGFKAAKSDEWIIFWGSDDCAADTDAFHKVMLEIEKPENHGLDLLVCKGRYFNPSLKMIGL